MFVKILNLLILSLALVTAVPTWAASKIDWSDLIDGDAQTYEDPYRDLTPEQFSTLQTVVMTQRELGAPSLTAEKRGELEATLKDAEASLTADGIDIDWLTSQRWVVAERREKAATSVNPDVDGKTVSLSGFAIPAPPDPDGTPVAYLVPEGGMCSHTPPPNPNQMIRVRLNGQWTPRMRNEPVRLTGRLSHSPSQHELHMVDGPVQMKASFSMDVTDVQTLEELRGKKAVPEVAGH